eukprot:scaffold39216_cov17-Tisochrysis_lutea.AAC.1
MPNPQLPKGCALEVTNKKSYLPWVCGVAACAGWPGLPSQIPANAHTHTDMKICRPSAVHNSLPLPATVCVDWPKLPSQSPANALRHTRTLSSAFQSSLPLVVT